LYARFGANSPKFSINSNIFLFSANNISMVFLSARRRVCFAFAVCACFAGFSRDAAAQEAAPRSGAALESRNAMIAYSKKFIGTPYKAGGTDERGMDCSGFLYTVARESIGLQLPRTSAALYGMARLVSDEEREPGDILFFRTADAKISHAALYLGNDQFIHAASEGPNTGVIVSSLKETYWKHTYTGAGQILPPAAGGSAVTAAGAPASAVSPASDAGSASPPPRAEVRLAHPAAAPADSGAYPAFLSRVNFDASLTGDWTLFSTKRFMLISRGLQLTLHASYKPDGWQLYPGIGLGIGWDAATGAVNIPLTASISMDNGIRVYAGPVFTLGDTWLPETDTPTVPSIFPGVIGASWSAPPLVIGDVRISFMQDIHYQVYNNTDGAALSFFESLSAGLVFATGIRIGW
jgi:hypothetical protein